jgi:hypothetical protein
MPLSLIFFLTVYILLTFPSSDTCHKRIPNWRNGISGEGSRDGAISVALAAEREMEPLALPRSRGKLGSGMFLSHVMGVCAWEPMFFPLRSIFMCCISCVTWPHEIFSLFRRAVGGGFSINSLNFDLEVVLEELLETLSR